MKAIDEAVEIAINCQKYIVPPDIQENIEDWYNHTDITDPFVLAAAALEFGSYDNQIYLEELLENTIEYFPERGLDILYKDD